MANVLGASSPTTTCKKVMKANAKEKDKTVIAVSGTWIICSNGAKTC